MVASHLLYTDHILHLYNGLGERLAVDVVEHDTIQVVLDYASGYVRQGANAQGQVVSSWLFDPAGSD
jgi:hypothetical protein